MSGPVAMPAAGCSMLERDLAMWWQEPWLRQIAGGAAAVSLALLAALVWFVRRRRTKTGAEEPELAAIDVGALEPLGPGAQGPQLAIYGMPVRLAIVVMAPVGRDGRLPPPALIPDLLEQLIPGMRAVLAAHAPEVVCWPGQLSSTGFVRSFFHHIRLPGDRGRETPWASVAGRFRTNAGPFLIGLVLCAARDNSLSQFEIQQEGQWNDVLRINH